jgi:hypothetical protein
MSIDDCFAILNSTDSTAATQYLRATTTAPLKEMFMPIVETAIKKVNVTSYWTPIVTGYNTLNKILDLGPIVNPNLEEYITDKSIDGLMTLIADEETKIRNNPAARVTDLLKKVFGNK